MTLAEWNRLLQVESRLAVKLWKAALARACVLHLEFGKEATIMAAKKPTKRAGAAKKTTKTKALAPAARAARASKKTPTKKAARAPAKKKKAAKD